MLRTFHFTFYWEVFLSVDLLWHKSLHIVSLAAVPMESTGHLTRITRITRITRLTLATLFINTKVRKTVLLSSLFPGQYKIQDWLGKDSLCSLTVSWVIYWVGNIYKARISSVVTRRSSQKYYTHSNLLLIVLILCNTFFNSTFVVMGMKHSNNRGSFVFQSLN